MKTVGAYTLKENDEDRFVATLSCGCQIPIPTEFETETDIPCPLHEEYRFTGAAKPILPQ